MLPANKLCQKINTPCIEQRQHVKLVNDISVIEFDYRNKAVGDYSSA